MVRRRRSVEEWEQLAAAAVLDMLATVGPMTASEMEARASDRYWNREIADTGIDPHHLGTARSRLRAEGHITEIHGVTRGGSLITTWCLTGQYNTRTIIDGAARKRLLTARHDGWARRGGKGIGLLGQAGELAMHQALVEAGIYAPIVRSTHHVLDLDLTSIGEIDFVCGLYDVSIPTAPAAITVMIEVKNTRHWHYADRVTDPDGDLRRFLRKAAIVQRERPDALVCPVIVARKAQTTLIDLGGQVGFVVASTAVQVVLPDHDLLRNPDHFAQVRDELGYSDMRLLNPGQSTNYHRGIAAKHIPKNARATAERWRQNSSHYLQRADLDRPP